MQTNKQHNCFRSNVSLLLLGCFVFWSPLGPEPCPVPCLWDYETLQMEKARFPSALELITGEFRRHSPEFHQWRIKDRLEKIAVSPDKAELYDDLAVSYEKTSQTDLAIKTMLKKEQIQPGMYETRANLGTFYVHARQFEKGLVEINKAIEINPDAHFGREIYQKLLVEYVIYRQGLGEIALPLSHEQRDRRAPTGFAKFVIESQFNDAFNSDQKYVYKRDRHDEYVAEASLAIKGILGMMRFGNFESPVLLEALGDLLMFQRDTPRHLATRVYLKASYESSRATAKSDYRKLAESALHSQTISPKDDDQMSMESLESAFQKELAAADSWYEGIRQNERDWIVAENDVEAEYAKVYYEEPADTKIQQAISQRRNIQLINFAGWMLAGCALAGILWILTKKRRNNFQQASKEA